MQSERSLSESVSAILILCLAVILFLIIASLFFGNIRLDQKGAYMMPNISSQVISGNTTITIFHHAGDAVQMNTSSTAALYTIGVYIDTLNGSSRAEPVIRDLVFKPGMTLYIYNTTAGYQATTRYQDLSAPGVLPVTVCPLRVRIVDESSSSRVLVAKQDIPCTYTGPAPIFKSMNITDGKRGWPIGRRVDGLNFLPGMRVALNATGGAPAVINPAYCTFLNSTRVDCAFTLPPDPLAPESRAYTVILTNPDGKQAVQPNYFTVRSPAPLISTITPATGTQGTSVAAALTGDNFQPGATVLYHNVSTRFQLSGVTVHNATTITGTLNIPVSALPVYYNVTVTNVDSRNVTRSRGFRVLNNAPTVTGLSNRTGYRGWTVIENITGTNFAPGATARFNGTGLADISPASCTYVSTVNLLCTFNLLGLPASASNGYNIVVINPDTKLGMRARYFTLSSPAPTISSSTPSTGTQGTTVPITNLAGNYFQPGATVTYWQGPPAAPAISLPMSVSSIPVRTQITGTLSIPAGARTGYYNITVMNTDGKSVTRTSGFRVYAVPPPSITGITPAKGGRGSGVPVVVTGANIVSGARVRLYNGTTAVYTAPTGTVTSSQISTTFTVGTSVLPGKMNVRITNPDGQYAILPQAYELT